VGWLLVAGAGDEKGGGIGRGKEFSERFVHWLKGSKGPINGRPIARNMRVGFQELTYGGKKNVRSPPYRKKGKGRLHAPTTKPRFNWQGKRMAFLTRVSPGAYRNKWTRKKKYHKSPLYLGTK